MSAFRICYFLSVGIALLNYGAVDLITVAMLAVFMFATLAALSIIYGTPNETREAFYSALAVLMASALWVLFQTLPLPGEVFAHPSWQSIKTILPEFHPTISVTPADDRMAFVRIAAPFGVYFVGLFLFRDDKQAEGALKIICLTSGLTAMLSISQFSLTPDQLLLGTKGAYLDSLTGFFVNRNTAATFFGLTGLINLALMIQFCIELNRGGGLYPRSTDASWNQRNIKKVFWSATFGIAALSCYTALMLTKSRAGVGSTFVATVLLVFFDY